MHCDACGIGELVEFADLGEIPVYCGVHFGTREEALASPAGRAVLAYCPTCSYVRNVAFDPSLVDPHAAVDMDLLHSPLFREFTEGLAKDLAAKHPMRDIVDLGCAQGDFLRMLQSHTNAAGTGLEQHACEPLPALPPFDFFVSRHLLEHLTDPLSFLTALRAQAVPDVRGYIEVPDATFDLAGAGWQIIYPHVSYFGPHSLHQIITRAGWQVTGGGSFLSGLLRYAEIGPSTPIAPDSAAPLLDSIAGFADRARSERDRWRTTVSTVAGDAILWGAGSRGVQFLQLADPSHRLAAVVDVNPRKWHRYLPVTGHQVLPPSAVASLRPKTVIITNPIYRDEIAATLLTYDLTPEILIA